MTKEDLSKKGHLMRITALENMIKNVEKNLALLREHLKDYKEAIQ